MSWHSAITGPTAVAWALAAGAAAAVPAAHVTRLPDDSATSAQVRARLEADAEMRTMPIRVWSHQGAVRLAGSVASEAHAERAAALAHEVPGVWRVQNALAVRTPRAAPPCPAGARPAGGS